MRGSPLKCLYRWCGGSGEAEGDESIHLYRGPQPEGGEPTPVEQYTGLSYCRPACLLEAARDLGAEDFE